MATFFGKLKSGLEWLELGKLVVDILGGLLAGKTVQALLVKFTSISPIWVTPLWLAAASIVTGFLVFLGNRKRKNVEQNPQRQVTLAPVAPEAQYKNVEEFYKTYDNSMLLEAEGYIQKESNQYKPGLERERFLIRNLASFALTYVFDMIWYTGFGSQLKAIEQLNAGPLSTAQIRTFYDEATQRYPNMYPSYSFDKWLYYLQSWCVLVQSGDTFSISIRGREFLKYLVHEGRLIDTKAY
jgi:hypothetical protein